MDYCHDGVMKNLIFKKANFLYLNQGNKQVHKFLMDFYFKKNIADALSK